MAAGQALKRGAETAITFGPVIQLRVWTGHQRVTPAYRCTADAPGTRLAHLVRALHSSAARQPTLPAVTVCGTDDLDRLPVHQKLHRWTDVSNSRSPQSGWKIPIVAEPLHGGPARRDVFDERRAPHLARGTLSTAHAGRTRPAPRVCGDSAQCEPPTWGVSGSLASAAHTPFRLIPARYAIRLSESVGDRQAPATPPARPADQHQTRHHHDRTHRGPTRRLAPGRPRAQPRRTNPSLEQVTTATRPRQLHTTTAVSTLPRNRTQEGASPCHPPTAPPMT